MRGHVHGRVLCEARLEQDIVHLLAKGRARDVTDLELIQFAEDLRDCVRDKSIHISLEHNTHTTHLETSQCVLLKLIETQLVAGNVPVKVYHLLCRSRGRVLRDAA